MQKHAKILCTLGPASSTKIIIRKMIQEGMDVIRLNFSHGNHQEHKKRIDVIRSLNRKRRRPIKILQDLEGFRIRVGHLENPILLKKGEQITITKESLCKKGDIPFDYEGDLKKIRRGLCLFMDDGQMMVKVIRSNAERLTGEVVFGGLLKERKGINIPGFNLQSNVMTLKDQRDMVFGIAQKVDFIAQSFVRNKKDIERVVRLVKPKLPKCKFIAKIENQDGITHLDEIMEACDGIMIARGDLGISVPIYKIAMIQKDIIRRCNKKKKFVITATQMLENMVEHNRPTRAEVTDVANAILDGTDYVMLSAETASGRFPVQSVRMMRQIVDFTEGSQKAKR
ncbi:MAG: pyruvate kinase [Candidatus Omnitrophota bacterium]